MGELATEADIASIPKIELHVHYGGVLTEALAAQRARNHGIDPTTVLPQGGRYPARYEDFPHFLRVFLAANSVIRTADDVEQVSAAFAQAQAAQGIVYSEVMVTAMTYVRQGIPPRDLWAALRSGLSASGDEARVTIVVDAVRDFGPHELEETIRVVDGADAPIVGLALTGIEGTHAVEEFAFIRREADRMGMGVAIHAGEMGPPENIYASLDILGADRIDHGVAASTRPELLERLVRDQVPLDVCPTSNVKIGLFPSLEAHPVREFWRQGVNFNISSDDPPFMAVTLADELANVTRLAGLTRDDLAELQRRAARAAFLPTAERQSLVSRVDAWVATSAS